MAKRPIALEIAAEAADALMLELAPVCERIHTAGSVRRKEALVGDLELVAIPKWNRDLLGQMYESLVEARLLRLMGQGVLRKGRGWGPKYKHCGLPLVGGGCMFLDLYLVSEEEWPVAWAIRTGPADYSKAIVTPRRYGGLLADGYRIQANRLRHELGGRPIHIDSEHEFLHRFAGGYLPPHLRGKVPPREQHGTRRRPDWAEQYPGSEEDEAVGGEEMGGPVQGLQQSP